MKKEYSGLLVACQFIILALLAISTNWRNVNIVALPILFASLFLAVWALRVMRLGRFNIRPAIKEGAILITHGPYRFIRHPMYASILLAGLGLIIITFSWLRLAGFFVVWLVLYLKLRIEEKLLVSHFHDYSSYKKKSRMFFPWF